ncbi:MAG: hypothetical protein GY779_04065 [Gammaproteobacteria bacterium]|nr:hypothetical protein [Gammaproteobacteria bacterium]
MKSSEQPKKKVPGLQESIIRTAGLCCIVWLSWQAFTAPVLKTGSTNDFKRRLLVPCIMDNDGYLRGQLYGTIQSNLDWHGANMRCDGMQRPGGQGIRLVFDEHLDEDQPGLLIVIGIADAILGQSIKELPANITIINQSNSQFFSTQEQPRCWTTFDEQILLTGTTKETWRINGHIYCASALAELTGPGSITLGEIEFSGLFKPDSGQN